MSQAGKTHKPGEANDLESSVNRETLSEAPITKHGAKPAGEQNTTWGQKRTGPIKRKLQQSETQAASTSQIDSLPVTKDSHANSLGLRTKGKADNEDKRTKKDVASKVQEKQNDRSKDPSQKKNLAPKRKPKVPLVIQDTALSQG